MKTIIDICGITDWLVKDTLISSYTIPVLIINELVNPSLERKMNLVIPDTEAFSEWIEDQ